ncbi:MAG: VWA domain-containing protein [Bacillota bacterium]
MEFARPWFLVLVPLSLLPLLWRRRWTVRPFSSFLVLPRDRLSEFMARLERVLGALYVAAAVLSLAEPRSPPRTTMHWTRGARLAFVLDQSASMFAPWSGSKGAGSSNKVAIALEAIARFSERRPNDAVGLIGFGESSILYAYPTTDHSRLTEALELVQSDLGGTVIDSALLRALDVLKQEADGVGSQAVVLLSDGEGRVLQPEALARRFIDEDVDLYWLLIDGGAVPASGMRGLMGALGPRGRTFVVSEISGMQLALDAIGRLANHPIRVRRWSEGRAWAEPVRVAALACLLCLGVFALGGRAAPGRERPQRLG